MTLGRVFIVGPTRSGTSLLQRLLAEATGYLALPESHLFTKGFNRNVRNFVVDIDSLIAAILQYRHQLDDVNIVYDANEFEEVAIRISEMQSTFEIVDTVVALYDRLTVFNQAPGWIEKTPAHSTRSALIASAHTRPSIVHMTRSSQPTIRSRSSAAREWGSGESYLRSVAHWVATSLISNCRVQYGETLVDFNCLVTQPNETVKKLCARLDIALIDARPNAGTANQAVAPSNEPWRLRALEEPDASKAYASDQILDRLFNPTNTGRFGDVVARSFALVEPRLAKEKVIC
ncbi:MAG: sulfotransferase [Acidimicrobiales bacterium]